MRFTVEKLRPVLGFVAVAVAVGFGFFTAQAQKPTQAQEPPKG